MSTVRVILILIFFSIIPLLGYGQMDDFFRSTGKIYVVVASLLLIFLGLVLFMIYLGRKVQKLEKQFKEYEQSEKK